MDLVGWIACLAIFASISFSTYDMVKEQGDGPGTWPEKTIWPEERLVMWEVVSRSGWGVAICWTIFSAHYGGGGQ